MDAAVAFPQADADREPADGEERGTVLAAAGGEIGGADRRALAAGDEVPQRDQVLAERDRKPHRQAVHREEPGDETGQIGAANVQADDGARVATSCHHVAVDQRSCAEAKPRVRGDDARPPSWRGVLLTAPIDDACVVDAHLRAGEIPAAPGVQVAHRSIDRDIAVERHPLNAGPAGGEGGAHPPGEARRWTPEVERERAMAAVHSSGGDAEGCRQPARVG